MSAFSDRLSDELAANRRNDHPDNWDTRRFGPERRLRLRFKQTAKDLLAKAGLRESPARAVAENSQRLDDLYLRLHDDESRDTLIRVLCYRILGYRKVKLPLNTERYWTELRRLEDMAGVESVDLGFNGWRANRFALESLGYPIELFVRPMGLFTQLLLQQYRCPFRDGSSAVEVSPGDFVMDAGACYGDTALYFAHKAGPGGAVFSFEFMPENLALFERNMALNPELSGRISLERSPLWDASGRVLYVRGSGPAARVSASPGRNARRVVTVTIDDFARDRRLGHVDFIKMDIEGAEPKALAGAERTLRQFRPKLAISVYHDPHHFWQIPEWIDGLGLDYRFALRHFTIHAEETVLFAWARA